MNYTTITINDSSNTETLTKLIQLFDIVSYDSATKSVVVAFPTLFVKSCLKHMPNISSIKPHLPPIKRVLLGYETDSYLVKFYELPALPEVLALQGRYQGVDDFTVEEYEVFDSLNEYSRVLKPDINSYDCLIMTGSF